MQRFARLGKHARRNVEFCRLLLQDTSPETVGHWACSPQSAQRRMYSSDVDVETARRYVPRRTLMYVPGHDMKKLLKIPDLGVDCAVLECEDGVALNKKVSGVLTLGYCIIRKARSNCDLCVPFEDYK